MTVVGSFEITLEDSYGMNMMPLLNLMVLLALVGMLMSMMAALSRELRRKT